MADSKRQQLIDAIDTRFKTITIANGYNTNAGAAIYPWLSRSIASGNLIALVYRDQQEATEAATVGTPGYHRRSLNIDVEVLVSAGGVTVETMRKVLADIETAIGTDTRWGGLAQYTQPGSNRIDVDQESTVVAGANISFTVVYQTKAWNPYL